MDNGHKGAIYSSNPEMDDNLNLENWQESLKEAVPAGMPTPEQLAPTPEHLATNLEHLASTSEQPILNPEQPTSEQPILNSEQHNPDQFTPKAEAPADSLAPQEPALGQITPLNTPVSTSQSGNIAESKPYNPANIKTEGDYLDKNSLLEIEKLEDKLSQDGDLNSFYDHTRDLTEVNLNNSFNRKLYQNGVENGGGN